MPLSRIALSSIVFAGLASGASAAYVNATFTGVTPGVAVHIKDTANGIDQGSDAGGFNWTRTGGTATDPYLATTYVTFCIDLKKHVSNGGNYGFSQTSLDQAPTPSGNGVNYPMGATKAAMLGQLWGAYRGGLSSNVDFGAFQLAVWEIVFENSGTLDVNTGNFVVTLGNADAASARSTANTWLGNLGLLPSYGGVYALTGDVQGGPQDQLVPTPGSLALCGLGGLVLARRRR